MALTLLSPEQTLTTLKHKQTASQRAIEINSVSDASAFLLVTDETHWAALGITTGNELNHYLAVCDYVSTYKEVNGFKLKRDFSTMTVEEIENERKGLEAVVEVSNQEAEVEKPVQIDERSKPLTYNPFANLKLSK